VRGVGIGIGTGTGTGLGGGEGVGCGWTGALWGAGGAEGCTSIRRTVSGVSGDEPAITMSGGLIFGSTNKATCAAIETTSATMKRR